MAADSIARLQVTLDHVEPKVMRRIEVPLTLRLDRLHAVLQAAMPWQNCHLWQFRVRDLMWTVSVKDWNDMSFGPRMLDAARTSLFDVVERTGAKSIKYTYDFGDDWEHTIRIERIAEAEAGVLYPRLIEESGRCPPEDCGGPWGYMEMREAHADPAHERHEEVREWWGEGPLDLTRIDSIALARAVAIVARRWKPKRKAA